MPPSLPGATILSKLLVVQPQDGATLLISNSELPSFLTLKVNVSGVPGFTTPKECSSEAIIALGAPVCGALFWAETENASIRKIGTKPAAALDFIQLPSKKVRFRVNGRQ